MRNNVPRNQINHQDKSTRLLKWLVAAVLLSSLTLSSTCFSKEYKVEVLVFKNNNPSTATENTNYVEPRESKSGSQTWLLEPSMLLDQASRISNSSNYTLMHHFSWGQEALPYQKSANYSVIEQEVRGWIKVYAEQLLFANIDLDYLGYRMVEKRRLKLNERHYFDHPKFGLLVRVSRLEANEKQDTE